MTEFDIPWQQPETKPATIELFDESPFEASQFGAAEATEFPAMLEDSGVLSEGLLAGCGQPPVGPRPLLLRGAAPATSRNPTVGYAQGLLNTYVAAAQAGTANCKDTSAATGQYIRSLQSYLTSIKQIPLVIDCVFGPGTEAATKMFQACRGLVRDGRIGPRTWPELEALSRVQPGPTPVPVPPGPTPTPTVRVREDVWTLSATNPWHPTLLWYARGVKSLQGRNGTNFADPRSWRHLAEAHGTDLSRGQWPGGAIWDACEHDSWHFLPWHRVYLYHFERIMRDEIVRLGGPQDWALPYWNYSDSTRPNVRRLPPAFRAASMPDNSPNPLRVERRGRNINDGAQISTDGVDTTDAFRETAFTVSFGAGFGGRSAPAGTHSGAGTGALENHPHGDVHIQVGGRNGLMSRFETAAQDPIFWLHHANIDRLWEAWLRARPTNKSPADNAWLTAPFSFGSGATTTTLRTRQVVDTRGLGYRYSDMPVTPTPEALAERPDEVPEHIGEDEARPPELVGASSGAVPIGSQPTSTRVDITAPTGPVARSMTEAGAPPPEARVYLRLENITATAVGSSGVKVYVNIPQGARPDDFPDRRAGTVSLFGVIEASQRTATHSGSGRDATFDITHIVRALSAAGAWDPQKLQVNFVPIPDATGQLARGDVQVGRVSLFYA